MAETSTQTVPIPGSERERPPGCKHIEPLPADEQVSAILLIRPPVDSPPVPDLAYWQNTPLNEQHFISPKEYAEIYGASQADHDLVLDFATKCGMTIVDHNAASRRVTISATANQIEESFGVKLHRYESPEPRRRHRPDEPPKMHVHHGYDGQVYVPQHLSGIVTAVVGLDNRHLSAPLLPTGDPLPSKPLLAPDLAKYYDFPNAGASDQVIGIIEFVPSAYLASDFYNHYFPSLPPGYQTPPKINAVSVLGGTNTPPLSYETCVDISVSGAIAQGVTLNVYFAPNADAGWIQFLHQVLAPGSEPQPTVLSLSWLLLDDSPLGPLTSTGSFAYIMTHLFQDIAYQGINVFAASGDWGSSDLLTGPHVGYPTSDPWVTSCGGTMLGDVVGSSFQEWVWSDMGGVGSFPGATGGGSSAIFPIPPYQKAAGITNISDSSGKIYTNRFVPDIAGMISQTGFFLGGTPTPTLDGTSLVAPLYAGLTAVVRSALGVRLGPLNPILYKLRDIIFNDITYGNNDPANGSAYFTATVGYDACTGWGSIKGIKFLDALVKLIFVQRLYFVVDKHTYDLDEVKHVPSYPTAFRLVLEGFTPNAVGTQKPKLTGAFSTLTGVNITVGPPTPQFPGKIFTPQRISYTCSIDFSTSAIHTVSNGGVFPGFGDPPIHKHLDAEIKLLGETVKAKNTLFKLASGFGFKGHEDTGEVTGLIYDRFGYFDGFLLVTERGAEKWFKGEKNAETLLRFAWEKKALISVLDEHHDHSPNSIILRKVRHQ